VHHIANASTTTDARPAAAPDRTTGLHADRVIPKQLVHKSSGAGVLLAHAVPTGENRFGVTTRWPAVSRLFHAGAQGEPVLMAEAMRQSAIYLSHDQYGVPLGHLFLLGAIDVDIADQAAAGERRDGTAPMDVALSVQGRTPRRFSATLRAGVTPAPGVEVRGELQWDALHPAAYARIRGNGPGGCVRMPRPGRPVGHRMLAAEAVGCRWQTDVLLAEHRGGLRLVLDTGHPGYFDHEVDHVPGMVFLEAFRQASYHAVRHRFGARAPRIVRLTARFNAFCDFVTPTEIRAVVRAAPLPGHTSLEVVAMQGGRSVASMLAVWQLEGGGRGFVPAPRSAGQPRMAAAAEAVPGAGSPAAGRRVQATAF
jgi:hypothetical protein